MPKRIGYLKDKLLSKETFYRAFEEGTEHKKADKSVRELWTDEAKAKWIPDSGMSTSGFVDQKKLDALGDDIISDLSLGTYMHGSPRHIRMYCTSKSKGTTGGKWREIYCPGLKDHIVQHMLCDVCEPAFTRGMYRFCVGNVPNRGNRAVIETVTKWCSDCDDWKYFVKLDIRHFFESIRIEDVQKMLRRKIKDEFILALHDSVLKSAPVPVPIGYFLSPWYGNLVLEPLDHMIAEDMYKLRRGKHIKTITHYIRFVDDMLLMGNSKRDIQKAVRQIEEWLINNLGMHLKPSWEIKKIAEYGENDKIKKGTYQIDLIGYRFDRTRTILRDTAYLSTKRLAHRLNRKQITSAVSLSDCQTYVSKTGMASHVDNHHLSDELNKEFPIIQARMVISNDAKQRVFRTADAVRNP